MQNIELSPDQQRAFTAVHRGRNLFLTARAGAGKSFLINHIIATSKKQPLLCASTGIAAILIGGRTLHSQFKISFEQDARESAAAISGKREYEIRTAKILIIDEVSMVSDKLLDCVSDICKLVRKKPLLPFGGLQIIVCGDFLQLPPVFRGENADGKYCIHAKSWQEARIEPIMLTTNFRQGHDNAFYDILTRIRYDCVNQKVVDLLKSRDVEPGENTIRLYSTNNEVDAYNQKMYCKLDSKTEKKYNMLIYGEPAYVNNFLKNSLYAQELLFRKNARVILIANLEIDDVYLCNGSLGTLVGYDDGFPRVRFDCGVTETITIYTTSQKEKSYNENGEIVYGDELLHVEQIPLKLAWAVSIHKSQGQTFDNAYIDCLRVFAFGQIYVALSRVKSLDGIYIKNFDIRRSLCEPTMVDWYIELEKKAKELSPCKPE